MNGGNQLLDTIEMNLRSETGELLPVYIDVYDNSLSHKWLAALNDILKRNLHLEKNYCFFGFAQSVRGGQVLIDEINQIIDYINSSSVNYTIDDHFTLANSIDLESEVGPGYDCAGLTINHDHFNNLHRYFEDLEGTTQNPSPHALQATPEEKWHIRQLNLLCHEFESWALSNRKQYTAPEWQRPSQLMCWINAPKFVLDEEDYELFGIDTISRPTGGVFVGVNKAVGKHHWEVFCDEGRDSRIDELTTTTLRAQTLAAGDFDIEWAKDPSEYHFQKEELAAFRTWLTDNGFNPDDKSLTIGHPQVGQVDLKRTFGTEDLYTIWDVLYKYLDVYSIRTSDAYAEFDYHWSDPDFVERQVKAIGTH
jgi:hypothetical protein